MKCLNDEEKDIKEKNQKNKDSILGKKSSDHFFLNLVAALFNNMNLVNNQNVELSPTTDLEFNLHTNSNISIIDKLIYDLNIYYPSFDSKRENMIKDIINGLDVKDEYYKEYKTINKICYDSIPNFKKNMYLNLSLFPFSYYDIKKSKIMKYDMKLKINDDKFGLVIYESKIEELNSIIKIIKDLKTIVSDVFDYFQNIYVIFQVKSYEDLMEVINDDKVNKIFLENDNNDDNQKIKYIFDDISLYNQGNNSKEGKNMHNLYDLISLNNKEKYEYDNVTKNKYGQEYYFILDQNNKVISINGDIWHLVDKIFLFIVNFKKEKKSYLEIVKEKENKKNEKFKLLKEVISFISKLKELKYIFTISFNLSFNVSINKEFSNIMIKKIKSIDLRGEFRTKEYNYLTNLLNSLKSKNKNIYFDLIEFPTIDIDVDFTDMTCLKCSKIIPEDKHFYYCYECNVKYCYECVQEQLKKSGKEKYIDKKHNLLFFKTRNKNNFKNLDRYKLGNNKFTESDNDDDFSESHSAICNGCSGHFLITQRYVCITCRPGKHFENGFIDFCQQCITKMCNDENSKKVLEEKANDFLYSTENNFTRGHQLETNHKHDEDIYLFLPLQYEGVRHPYDNY